MSLVWDKGNRGHAAKHGVIDAEIEQLFRRSYYFEVHEAEGDEEQYRANGTTNKGRYLTAPFSVRNDRIRPITAWPMTAKEFEDYANEIH